MPLPKKRKGESRAAFVDRCMMSSDIKAEFSTNAQRVAVCLNLSRGSKSAPKRRTSTKYS